VGKCALAPWLGNIATNCVDLAKRQAENSVGAQLCAGSKVAGKAKYNPRLRLRESVAFA
jgi:hypothetical protein